MAGSGSQLGNSYMYEVVQGDKTGYIGTISASDDDVTAPNNEITLTAIGQSSKHVTAYDTGAVIYANTFDDDPAANHKTSQFVYIEAKDNGVPALSSTCKIQNARGVASGWTGWTISRGRPNQN